MAMMQTQRRCKTCGKKTLHARPKFSSVGGCLLSVLTLGLFLPFWGLIMIGGGATGAWRCQVCGRARWS